MADSTTASSRPSKARQRIVETAERLFYAEGIRAVGIDRIITEADVAKMTLYNHFASKDELVLAVLQYREGQVDAMFRDAIDHGVAEGKNRLEAFFAALREWFESPGFRGCSFINASVELANEAHPASRFATEHKKRMAAMFKKMAVEAGGQPASRHADAIGLLVEGAIVTAVMNQSAAPADVARDAALALVGTA